MQMASNHPSKTINSAKSLSRGEAMCRYKDTRTHIIVRARSTKSHTPDHGGGSAGHHPRHRRVALPRAIRSAAPARAALPVPDQPSSCRRYARLCNVQRTPTGVAAPSRVAAARAGRGGVGRERLARRVRGDAWALLVSHALNVESRRMSGESRVDHSQVCGEFGVGRGPIERGPPSYKL